MLPRTFRASFNTYFKFFSNEYKATTRVMPSVGLVCVQNPHAAAFASCPDENK